VQVVYS